MSRLRNYLLAFVSLFACSCAKVPFSNGEVQNDSRSVKGNFTVLDMGDNVDVILVKDNHPIDSNTLIDIRANANLINNIITEIHGDTLTIKNESGLNWIRPYDCTIEATVHYDSIQRILFNSNGKLNTDLLRGYPFLDSINNTLSKHLYLDILGGSGDIDLNVNCDLVQTYYDWGTSSVKLKGKVGIANITTSYNSHGPVDAQNLETNYHFIYSYGTNKIIAKAFNEIHADNHNNGIVCYVRYHVTRPETVWGHYDSDGIWIPAHTANVTHVCPKRVVYTGAPNKLDSIVMN